MVNVTLIIPVFNANAYLAACLESVRNQSLREIEIICIDDGSTDGSAVTLDGMARSDPRVRVFHGDHNMGAGAARNRGIRAARGRFIRFVDADDVLPPCSTEILYSRSMETGTDAVRGSLAFFSSPAMPYKRIIAVADKALTTFKLERDLWIPWWHTSYLLSADLIRSHELCYPNLKQGEDPVFLASVLVRCRHISLVSDIVYLCRRYPKKTGSAAVGFAYVADWLAHASRVKCEFYGHYPESWDGGYGPFLLARLRNFLGRCPLTTVEKAYVQTEVQRIWGGAGELLLLEQ